jgi:steroid delta-isomerase-like uncharacterized protein
MKKSIYFLLFFTIFLMISCNNQTKQVEENIKMYTNTWDEIINKRNLELFNDSNFTSDITLLMSPENIVGIDNVKAFYNNYLTGFSDIEFTIVDVFGQGDKIVKHWNFKGTHTGEFFGIPATGKSVNIDGTTLVKMKDGKIAEEQDFMDNMAFMQQLGLVSSPENVSVVNNAYKSFAKGDVPAVLASLDSNVVWNEAENFLYADGNPYKGHDAVVNGVFARLGSEWDYFKLADIKLYEMSSDYVLSTGRYQAKYKKNGVVIDAQFAHLWKLKDGKVISFQQYTDTKQVANAVKK